MDRQVSHLWIKRSLYLFLAVLIMFLHLLPLDTQPDRWPFPDLLIALTFAWVLRRPEYVPILLVAAVMMIADLLLQRPPGLLAALVVLGTAYLRSAGAGMRDAGFVAEWTTAAIVITGVFVLNRVILAILSVQQAALGPVVIQIILTIAAYPLIVLLSQNVFGVRRLSVADPGTGGVRV
ncbi:rod shape-determining protein MreD [Ruegeria sp. Ofav3-42]|uniref:rod shape-determining protein MreD n=1 Tax=Ruegeria sp. Ofav3-42 TaxID=2917759 RepID=UPI001EF53769|nr:rod shape-determining protein MreD [Ruegeria sp. Ofav3-42]MCG7520122.1 rod shape-determining protein MreD [Ruegeria sp. Ofav3-42]